MNISIKKIKDKTLNTINRIKNKKLQEKTVADDLSGVEILDGYNGGTILGKSKMKRWKKVLLIWVSVVAGIAVILVSTFLIFRITGKSSLYSRATSEKPELNRSEREPESVMGELDINPDDMDEVIVIGGNTSNNNDSGDNTTDGSNGNSDNTSTDNNIEDNDSELSFEGAGGDSGYDLIYKGTKYAYNKDMITMLFLGIDTLDVVKPAKDGVSGGQSDALFLLVMNPHTMVMDIIAIHRNSIALVDVYDRDGNFKGSGYTQICLQHAYGGGMEKSNEMTKTAVSKMLYDLPIHSVTSINMGAVPQLNDSIGGVTLSSLETFETEGYTFEKGKQVTLKGMGAYGYVHYRNMYIADSAGMRLNRQKQYITQFMKAAISQIKSNVGKVVDVYSIISKYVVTDLSVDEMTYLASELVSYKFGGIYSFKGSLDTSGKWKYERYNLDKNAVYELIIDKFYEKVE